MKKILFSFIILLILFQSCSTGLRVEKRRYTEGYYVEVKENNKINNKPVQTVFSETFKPTITESAYYSDTDKDILIPKVPIYSNQISTENTIASATNKVYSLPVNKSHIASVNKSNKIVKKALVLPFKKHFLNKTISNKNKIKLNNFFNKASSSGAWGYILGGLLLVAGVLVLLFLSILFGIIAMVLGLCFLIIGAVTSSKNKSRSSENKNVNKVVYENVDVVYLKNGSMIRGSIIEMVMDDYVKIKMKDGSIFVYKLSEVEKITKEEVSE